VYNEEDGPRRHLYGLNDMKYVSVYEPAKIRGITIQDGYKNMAADPLKGALLQSWKDSPFSTMLYNDLTERVERLIQGLSTKQHLVEKFGFKLYCSGDYAGATDTIKMDATKIAISALGDSPYRKYADLMFAPGTIHYPAVFKMTEVDGKPTKTKIQASFSVPFIDGQPMGNPLSFPLLCFINTAIYHTCVDVWRELDPTDPDRREFSLLIRDLAIINGDDIAFVCNREFYDIFCNIAGEAGFRVSVGKQFLSPHFLQINSQMFRIRNNRVTRCHYLNLNLLMGNNIKGSSKFEMGTPIGISHDLNAMMENIPWSASCLPIAFQRFRKDFATTRFQPNWAIPHHLGGYGINPNFVGSRLVTREQRSIAARFLHNPSLKLYRKKENFYSKVKTQHSVESISTLRRIENLAENKVLVPLQEYVAPLPHDIYILSNQSPLSARIQIYKRFLFPSPLTESDEPVPDHSILRTNKRNAWIRPLSDEGFSRYNRVLPLYAYRGMVRPLNHLNPVQVARAFVAEPGFFHLPDETEQW